MTCPRVVDRPLGQAAGRVTARSYAPLSRPSSAAAGSALVRVSRRAGCHRRPTAECCRAARRHLIPADLGASVAAIAQGAMTLAADYLATSAIAGGYSTRPRIVASQDVSRYTWAASRGAQSGRSSVMPWSGA